MADLFLQGRSEYLLGYLEEVASQEQLLDGFCWAAAIEFPLSSPSMDTPRAGDPIPRGHLTPLII